MAEIDAAAAGADFPDRDAARRTWDAFASDVKALAAKHNIPHWVLGAGMTVGTSSRATAVWGAMRGDPAALLAVAGHLYLEVERAHEDAGFGVREAETRTVTVEAGDKTGAGRESHHGDD